MTSPAQTPLLHRFLRETSGAAAIEVAIWLPFFFMLAFFMIDLAIFLFTYAQLWDAARDAARAMSVGTLGATEAALNAWVQENVPAGHTASLLVSGRDVTVVIEGDTSVMSLFGFLSTLVEGLDTRVTMRQEPGF